MMIRASVVIPLYNDADTIRACLDALLAQTIAAQLEIVVVDDGSSDAGPDLVAQYPAKLVRQPNAGPAAARNAGAKIAQGEILLFLDADCIAPPPWAEQMLAAFDAADIVAAMGGIDSATDELLPQLMQTEIEERYKKLSGVRYIDFFASVAVAMRRDTFLSLGGFREDFRYSEDGELAYRIHDQGGKIVLAQAARVSHHHQTRWRDYAKTKFCRGLWRMRSYKLFPHKMVSDNWTPQTLKLQIVAAALLPLLLLAGAWSLAVALFLLGILSGQAFLRDAYRRKGLSLLLWGIPFLYLRAFALGSAMLWFLLSKSPVSRRA